MKFKNLLVQLLGVFTTLISIVLIYLILFKDGQLRGITPAMLIEFFAVIAIAISTKFFWYTSTENSVRNSQPYIDKRNSVSTAIEQSIDDAKNFDDFIEIENDANYNKYVSSRCKNMTVDNYRLSFFDFLHWLFKRKHKSWYMRRYMLAVERRANRQHKLSGANIRALIQSTDGLTDDRNKAGIKKTIFLWSGAVLSFISMFFTAIIAFETKENIDMTYAVTKLIMYVSSILFSILQAVLKARAVVSAEDVAYFNRILSILEKYEAYKKKPYVIEKVSYILEVVDESNNGSTQESSSRNVDIS